MSSVGGSRHTPATAARSKMLGKPVPGVLRVDIFHIRHSIQNREPDRPDAQLEHRIHPKRMPLPRDEARQQQAAQAHAPHERRQQDAQGNGGRADHQSQKLEPDHLVDKAAHPLPMKSKSTRGRYRPGTSRFVAGVKSCKLIERTTPWKRDAVKMHREISRARFAGPIRFNRSGPADERTYRGCAPRVQGEDRPEL